ncbi:MAG: hypothetical protein NTX50_18265 [Candidatus Sumerlaeota bacterium]|nr:hypothetical protein [Candidatus Sumerlaeota bacterium]
MARKHKKESAQRPLQPLSRETALSRDGSSSGGASGFERYYQLAWIPILVLLLAVPWPWAKVLLACVLLISLKQIAGLTRSQGMVALGSLFILAYLFAPYWLIPAGAERHDLAKLIGAFPARFSTIIVLLGAGALWTWLAAGEISPVAPVSDVGGASLTPVARKRAAMWLTWGAPAALAFLTLLINGGALYGDIPAGGDEIFHISRVSILKNILTPLVMGDMAPYALFFAAIAGVFVFWPRRLAGPIKLLIFAVAGTLLILYSGFNNREALNDYINRYPFISCWFQLIGISGNQYPLDEGTFRLLPLVSVFAIAWFMFRSLSLQGASWIVGMVGALLVILAPNVRFYAAALYLEMPAVALLTVAFYYIEDIIAGEFQDIRRRPAWYALLAAFFLKDSLFGIVAGVIGLRLLVRAILITRRRQWSAQMALQELMAAFCLGVPLGVYMVFRVFFSATRGYHLTISNLWYWPLWKIVTAHLCAQFAGLAPLALGGLLVGLWRRRYLKMALLLSLGIVQFMFHFLETGEYADLARFHLMLLPAVIVLMMEFLSWLARADVPLKVAGATAIAACFVLSIAYSPVTFAGDKMSSWPSNTTDSEVFFPYSQSVEWLKKNRPNTMVLIAGAPYDTCLTAYFNKANYPAVKVAETVKIPFNTPYRKALNIALTRARQLGYSLVLFHKMMGAPQIPDQDKSVLGYKAVAIIANPYRAMVVYELQKP